MLYRFLPIILFILELGTVYGVTAVTFASMQAKAVEEPPSVSLERREVRIVVVPSGGGNEKQPILAIQEETLPEVADGVETVVEKPSKLERQGKEVANADALLVSLMSESDIDQVIVSKTKKKDLSSRGTVSAVPFYSQFTDISSPSWQKVGCGIASLSMIVDYYSDELVSVDKLLERGIKAGAYIDSAGWSHAGLIGLARAYGLGGESVSMSELSVTDAFAELEKVLREGPVMGSVHYTFEPTNPIPHLVVINGVRDGKVFYNDPAESVGGGSISIEKFKGAWKKRYISIRPA